MHQTIARFDAEACFLEKLNQLDAALSDLNVKRNVLLRALAQERQRRISKTASTRTQARQCILIEIEVLAALRLAESVTLPANELLDRVRRTDPDLNPSTFRSVLHRMKAKKFIAPNPGRRGAWTLCPICRH